MTPTTESAPPPRDPERPARLLRAEHDALMPLLRAAPGQALDRPTACPGWSVRDLLAHCSAALSRAVTGQLHAFTPELNEIDVAERREWPLSRLLAELADGYLTGGAAIGAAGGRLDAIALGEWVHGGDVREALGLPGAYASAGFTDAAALLAAYTRRCQVPLTEVTLTGVAVPDAAPPGTGLTIGARQAGRPAARLRTSPAALIRLTAGRPADPADYQLAGLTTAELIVF
ncbi:MAG TPA: maleylpyruvate isomerase family mycothiol-dependent enzyme [Streptosporangiaceae bacterium]